MPLEILIPLVVGGPALTLGFFFVRHIGSQVIVTRFGTHLRATGPLGYWFWAVYYFASLVFIFALAIAIPFGLTAGD